MTEPPLTIPDDLPSAPGISHLVTEDDEPVDNFFLDKLVDELAKGKTMEKILRP